MATTLAKIAASLGAPYEGDGTLPIHGVAEPAMAGPTDLALAMSPAYAEGLAQGRARAAMVWPDADWRALGLAGAILAPRPRLAMAGVTAAFDPGPALNKGIHPSAVLDPTAQIGAGARIGPFAVIGPGTQIGDDARIDAHVRIGAGVTIGARALILGGVSIGDRVHIGDDVICQPGAVIGGDGFSFVTPERSHVEEVRATLGESTQAKAQSWLRIHSLGSVRIGDNVEVGANTTIDRGTIRDTQIGDGTKIDNLVQIGHNVVVGRDCLLCGQVGIAGSSRIGDRVVLGGKVGVVDNIIVGNDVVAGAGSLISSNAPAGRALMGMPAVRMDQNIAIYKAQRRLPRLAEQVAALTKAMGLRGGDTSDDKS